MNTCAYELCDRPKHGRNEYCNGHRQQVKQGRPLAPLRRCFGKVRVVDGHKPCTECLENLPLEAFSKAANGAGGRANKCRECKRLWYVQKQFGLSAERYKQMLGEQRGACLLCKDVSEVLVVDHNHACCPGNKSCGECVRGLLCHSCNITLGLVRDNGALLRSMADYLETRTKIDFGHPTQNKTF